MNEPIAKHYLSDALSSFRAYKKLAEKALDQITDEFNEYLKEKGVGAEHRFDAAARFNDDARKND